MIIIFSFLAVMVYFLLKLQKCQVNLYNVLKNLQVLRYIIYHRGKYQIGLNFEFNCQRASYHNQFTKRI